MYKPFRTFKVLTILLVFTVLTIALAQLGDIVNGNFSKYFIDAGMFGLLISGVTQFVKERTQIKGNYLIGFVFVLAIILSLIGRALGMQPDNTLVDSVVFGFNGAIAALTAANVLRQAKQQDPPVIAVPAQATSPGLPQRKG